MDDLKERFAEADQMMGRDHWRDIAKRAATAEEAPRVLEWPQAPRRRVIAAVVAFATFAAASVFAWNLSHPDVVPAPPPQGADQPVDLAAELPVGWSQLPAPPQVRRAAATAWTGSKLIQWGGYVYEEDSGERPASHEGSIFDAASRRWERMATGPLSARSATAAAWTGEEFLIWGGRTSDACCLPSDSEPFLDDGAAYDPVERNWRRLADAPIEARAPLSVWTGQELIVWGSTDRNLRYRDGAAYDPATDTWRRIADGPIDLTDAVAVWSGEEMIVFGAALHGGNVPETETAIGAAYDPATDSWRKLPASIDTNPNANTAAWAGDRLIAVDYDDDAEMYDPASGRWHKLQPMPLDQGESIPRAAYVERWLVVDFFGQVAMYSIDAERWTDLTDELAAEAPGTLFPSGPIPAGGVFLFLGADSDGPRLLAYHPPAPRNSEDSTDLGPGRLVVETQLRLDPGITDVAVGTGSVWVTGGSGVTRIDSATNQVLARIPVPGTGDHSRIAIGEGSVWVTAPELRSDGSRGNLVRIDPATSGIDATFHIGGPITGLGTGGGSVWVTIPGIGPGSLLRIDPATGDVLHRLRVGESSGSPVYGYGFMWVAGTDSLTKIDPQTGTVVDELPGPNVESSGQGSLWGVGDDSVIRLDPVSGEIQATVPVPRAAAVSVDGTTVWVLVFPRSSDPALFNPIRGTAAIERIDPATNAVIGEPLPLLDLQPLALSSGDGRVWVADFDRGVVTRIAVRPSTT